MNGAGRCKGFPNYRCDQNAIEADGLCYDCSQAQAHLEHFTNTFWIGRGYFLVFHRSPALQTCDKCGRKKANIRQETGTVCSACLRAAALCMPMSDRCRDALRKIMP